ncbi:hypothetical protein [Legionella maceachernii]|uniref:Uncharacterized protein n=1 Tax=Legionella maceachernii TaxID=466 RepID=A0A0W0VZJ6_9GAMM|nr:hypothetical protein [Legionella maceachernii]KTD25547.1 hypothetical protein Lmac_1911 [Legionella maceachernii]SJZ55891.1 hypothetical protein SAMN02745128_00398 [Legionella maceachernii]SUP00473.1 Uncharacterised protein [Legionella maceachernii]
MLSKTELEKAKNKKGRELINHRATSKDPQNISIETADHIQQQQMTRVQQAQQRAFQQHVQRRQSQRNPLRLQTCAQQNAQHAQKEAKKEEAKPPMVQSVKQRARPQTQKGITQQTLAAHTPQQNTRNEQVNDQETPDNLVEFFLSVLTEDSSFSDIRNYAKQAIKKGLIKDERGKEQWVLAALEGLQTIQQDTTIRMRKYILSGIEVIMLSRRVSNLRKAGIFSNQVNGNSNHVWLLDGAKLAVSACFPEILIHFIRAPESEQDLDNLGKSLQCNDSIWIILGYKGMFHLTLIRLIKNKDSIHAQLFDSLGAFPSTTQLSKISEYNTALYYLLDSIQKTQGLGMIVTGYNQPRQMDGTNCFSFIVSDLECALELIKKQENIFLETKEENQLEGITLRTANINPSFHNLTQVASSIPEEMRPTKLTIPLSKKTNSSLGNPLALNRSASTLSKLIRTGNLFFAGTGHQQEGESEEDKEECIIM